MEIKLANYLEKVAERNLDELKKNPYPGRGIIQGITRDGNNLVQIYWIMGRSENSRNRIFFIDENNFVKTKPYDESKVKDPSLIIYYPLKFYNAYHIISNGDQTDTVFDGLKNGKTFEESLESRYFEPDNPNFTPRITGIVDINDKKYKYKFSIIKSLFNDNNFTIRENYYYENGINGYGHCIHTYDGDGDPLPSFSKTPYIVKIFDSIEENINYYWDILNNDNKISLLVKFIDKNNNFTLRIVNKYN